MTAAGLGWVDWALLAALVLSVVIGLVRGLVFELMSLAGWVVAYVAAIGFAPQVAPHLPVGEPGSALNHAAALAACFIVTLVAWGLLARLVRMLVSATPLTVPDRLLGAAFGVLRGLVLLLALATIVSLTPAAQSVAWRQSIGAQWLGVLVAGLRPMLPAAVAEWLPNAPRAPH